MKKNKVSDDRLDEMLTNYCNRQPQYTFRLKKEAKSMKKKSMFKYAAAFLCVALLLCGGIFVPNIINSDKQPEENASAANDNSYTPGGFFVTAYAAEIDPEEEEGVKIDGVDTVMSSIYPPAFVYDSDGLLQRQCLERVGLKITGEDIESFDVSTDNGYMSRLNMDVYEEYHINNEPVDDDKIGDYFIKGKSLDDIAFDNDNPQRSMIDWWPSDEKLNNELRTATGIENAENPSAEEYEILRAEEKKLIQTYEDFTEYFGGTVSITVHYKDGTSESCNINISYDDEGYFVVSASN